MPAKSERQRRFMAAELGRKERGEATQTGMSAAQLKDYVRKPQGRKAKKRG